MESDTKAESAEACPWCGGPMESVYFRGTHATGVLVYQGEPPAGMLGQLTEVITGSLVRTPSGEPVLFGPERGSSVSGRHCAPCRQITIRYSP